MRFLQIQPLGLGTRFVAVTREGEVFTITPNINDDKWTVEQVELVNRDGVDVTDKPFVAPAKTKVDSPEKTV